MPKPVIEAEHMYSKMEAAIDVPGGSGAVDAIVRFARMVDGVESIEDVQGILDVDLEDCSPEYAKQFRKTWVLIDKKLTAVINGYGEPK
jgi:hypothetical protein